MPEPQRLDRRQQQLEELSAASVRALTGDARLTFRRSMLYCDEQPLPAHAPHLRVPQNQRDRLTLRGIADAQAIRYRYSDAALFRQTCPELPVERLIFELMEQLRAETQVPVVLPGVQANIRARFLAWSRGFHESGFTDTALGILLYTVTQMVWSRLNAMPVLADTEDLIEVTRASLAPDIGHLLAGMRRDRNDQAAFAVHAQELARIIAASVQMAQEQQADKKKNERLVDNAFTLLLDFDESGVESPVLASTGDSRVFDDAGQVYRIFTTQFDTEVNAADQVRADLLQEYRQELDELITRQGVNRSRLTRLLMRALAVPHHDGRRDGEEEGLIDGRRLALLVSTPADRRLFTQERYVPRAQCAVTFLLDSSGSMKNHIRPVALLVDILTRALERLGASTEVLGFTTGAWNGGRAYRQWLRAGRPDLPGRLNEVCYRVFKPATRTWRQSRQSLAAVFKPDLFREGIDGEAVQWAAARLQAQDVERRILVVISDGCPMDSATALVNDEFYLDNHLKQVVMGLERRGDLEILGIGVGLDLSPFYRRNVAVDLSQGLGNDALYDVARLLQRARR